MTKKKIACLSLIAALSVLAGCQSVVRGADLNDYIRIDDGADLLDSSEEDELYEQASALYEQAAEDGFSLDVFVVSTDDNDGKGEMEYSDDYYDLYAGDAEGGLVLYVDMEDRRYYVGTYDEMQFYLTDDRLDDMIDVALPDLKSGDYADFYGSLLDSAKRYLKIGPESGAHTYDPTTGQTVYYDEGESGLSAGNVIISFLLAIAGGLGFALTTVGRYRLKFPDTDSWSARDDLHLDLRRSNDIFQNHFVTTRRIPRNDGGPGGSGGGGSMSHSTGGGHSAGGHGGGF